MKVNSGAVCEVFIHQTFIFMSPLLNTLSKNMKNMQHFKRLYFNLTFESYEIVNS